MKIKTDFVTNSSSTSFLIITEGDLTKEELFELVGVTEQSPLAPIFEVLFKRFLENMVPGSEYQGRRNNRREDLVTIVRDEFSEKVASRVAEAQNSGGKVYIGKLSSEYDAIEDLFCCDSFELENKKMYLNALECTW